MPKRGQSDHSPGDRRQPFSNEGGPAGRHAQTHDVRREEVTNPRQRPPGEPLPELAADDQRGAPGHVPGHAEESYPAERVKGLHERLPHLGRDELAAVPLVAPGAHLEQGGTYLDLEDPARGPFTASGAEEVAGDDHYVPKRETEPELWNRLIGRPR